MIEGIGIDIIEIARVEKAISRPRFRERVFTEAERQYCDACSSPERYAGRFAAKEAIIKALGRGVRWKEMEILPAPTGAPVPRLSGKAAEQLGNRRLWITISHSEHYAVAQAIIEA